MPEPLIVFEKGNVTSKVHLFESLNQNSSQKSTSFELLPPKSCQRLIPVRHHTPTTFYNSYRPIQHHFMASNVKKMQANFKNVNLMHIESLHNLHATEVQEEMVIFHRLPGEPLGLDLQLDKTNTKWCVKSIVPQSTIDRISSNGMKSCIDKGDHIVAINGIKLSTLTYNEMISVLKDLPVRITVTFQRDSTNKQSLKHSIYKYNSSLYDSSLCSQSDNQLILQLQEKYKSLSIDSLTSVTSCDSKLSYFSDRESEFLDHEIITVTIFKERGEFLGLSVINGKASMSNYYQIQRISDNGIIKKTEQLHLGDYLYSINGIFLMAISETKLVRVLQNAEGTVELKILRSEKDSLLFQSWNPDDGLDVDQCFMGFSFYQHAPKSHFSATNATEMICKSNDSPPYLASSDDQRKITRLFPKVAHLDCAVQTSGTFFQRYFATGVNSKLDGKNGVEDVFPVSDLLFSQEVVSNEATTGHEKRECPRSLFQKLARTFSRKRSTQTRCEDEMRENVSLSSTFRREERNCTEKDHKKRRFFFRLKVKNKSTTESMPQSAAVEHYHVTEKEVFCHESSDKRFASYRKLLCTFARKDSAKHRMRLQHEEVEKEVLHRRSEQSASFRTSSRENHSAECKHHFSFHKKLTRTFSTRSCVRKHEINDNCDSGGGDAIRGAGSHDASVTQCKRTSLPRKVNFSTVSCIDPAELEASFRYLDASSSSEEEIDF